MILKGNFRIENGVAIRFFTETDCEEFPENLAEIKNGSGLFFQDQLSTPTRINRLKGLLEDFTPDIIVAHLSPTFSPCGNLYGLQQISSAPIIWYLQWTWRRLQVVATTHGTVWDTQGIVESAPRWVRPMKTIYPGESLITSRI